MIIDASVAFKWIFVEEGSDAATLLIGRDDLIAPSLLLAEIGNALWKKGRAGEIEDHAAFASQVGIVASMVQTVDEADVVPRALDIALAIDHAIYDCIYLALAEQLDRELVTADRKFVAKLVDHPLRTHARLLGV